MFKTSVKMKAEEKGLMVWEEGSNIYLDNCKEGAGRIFKCFESYKDVNNYIDVIDEIDVILTNIDNTYIDSVLYRRWEE